MTPEQKALIERTCTCPPDERPVPCARRYALTECRDHAEPGTVPDALTQPGGKVTEGKLHTVAEAIHKARFRGRYEQREPEPFTDPSDIEYAMRLAAAALTASPAGKVEAERDALAAKLVVAVENLEHVRERLRKQNLPGIIGDIDDALSRIGEKP